MWNTAVDVGQGNELSSGEPQLLGDWLGDDMYFQQAKTGEIIEIWYTDGDSPYFIEVKGTDMKIQKLKTCSRSYQCFPNSHRTCLYLSKLPRKRPSWNSHFQFRRF
jgi:hypothetical protein